MFNLNKVLGSPCGDIGTRVKCLVSSSTAQASMLELIAAHNSGVFAGVTAHSSNLCWSITAHSPGHKMWWSILKWRALSTSHPVESKGGTKKRWENFHFFTITRPQHMLSGRSQKRNLTWVLGGVDQINFAGCLERFGEFTPKSSFISLILTVCKVDIYKFVLKCRLIK